MSTKNVSSASSESDIFKVNRFARYYRYYMLYFVAIFGYAWIYVFGAHILMSQSTKGVSVPAIIIHMAVTVAWLVYGFIRKDKVIIVGSIVSMIGNLFTMIAIFVVTTL